MIKIKRSAIIGLLLAGLISGGFVISADAAAKKTAVKKTVKAAVATRVPRRLDGVLVSKKNSNNRILAVMIENHPAARPQAGLQQASVVYETLAEGGIPRFMALFSHYGDVGLVGPIRSARPYFVRWAAEYGAALVHAGGSPDAQILLKKLGLRNIEALKDPTAKYFHRIGSGVHSVFITGKKLERANNQYRKVTPVYRSWKYVNDPPRSGRRDGKHGATIKLGPGSQYTVGYLYSKATNSYRRSTGGRQHIERVNRRQVKVKNVILQFIAKERVLDRKGRIELSVLGRGKGVLLQNGSAVTITWAKKSTRGRTIYKTGDGKEITLNRGNTWITVIPKGRAYKIF